MVVKCQMLSIPYHITVVVCSQVIPCHNLVLRETCDASITSEVDLIRHRQPYFETSSNQTHQNTQIILRILCLCFPFILPTGSYQTSLILRLQAINIANSSKQTELHRIAGLGFPVYTRRISSDRQFYFETSSNRTHQNT